MTRNEKLKQFFEQVIYNAAQKTRDTSEIMPVIKNFVKELGIETGTESIEELNARIKAGELEAEKETAAAELAALGSAYAEADQGKRQELIEAVLRKCETLKKTVTTGTKGITLKELMKKKFPPRKWVVENLIGPGVSILSGASKIGKSWIALELGRTASTGGKFLDHYTVNKTPTLYLSLEDDEQGIKERNEIQTHKQAEEIPANDDLTIFTFKSWNEEHSDLETYLRAHDEIKFVIIDTLGQFMPDIDYMNDYTPAVKALTGIKRIADSLDIAILLVHHARKGSGKENQGDWMDQSLGSQGIVASADSIILIRKDIVTQTGGRADTGKFYATGRRIKDQYYNIKFSPSFGMWGITDKDKEPEPQNQDNQQDETNPPQKPEKILTRADIKGKG
jgi:hypothetical protein